MNGRRMSLRGEKRRRWWVRRLVLAFLSLAFLCGAVRGQNAPAPAPAAPASSPPKQATMEVAGDRVTMDLRGVALQETLRIVSEKTGLKFVVSSDFADVPVSVFLREVPIEMALRAMLSANGLYMEKLSTSDIFIVKSLDKAPLLSIAVITCKHVQVKQIEEVTFNGSFYKQRIENGRKVETPELDGKRYAEIPQQ